MIPATTGVFEGFASQALYARGVIDKFAAARLPKDAQDPTRPSRIPAILGDFTFLVKQRIAPTAATYTPPLECLITTNSSGFLLLSGETRSPSASAVRLLAPGRYMWRVESDFYQALEFQDDWPPAQVYDQSKDLQLVPGPAYPFPDLTLKQRDLGLTLVRGALFTTAGDAAQGATIELITPALPPSFAAFTKSLPDANGNWVLAVVQLQPEDPPPDFAHSQVRFTLSGGQQDVVDVAIAPGAENVIRQTALRGRVIQSGGVPVVGAKITTSLGAGNSFSRNDGQWAYYFGVLQNDAAATVTATAPDGRRAQQNIQIQRGKTLILPPMQVA